MRILLCIKQVPDTKEIKIDPVKHTLIREGVPSILNIFDGFALEAAARMKDHDPETKVTVITMGPDQAKTALRECLAVTADKAYLVSDRAFGGSDTLATSYTLSKAIRKIEETDGKFDAIFCGQQAMDGSTAQVGPEIAEHLGLPQVTYALECWADGDHLKVLQEGDGGNNVIRMKYPCLVAFTKPKFDPRFPTIRRKIAANRAEIPALTRAAFADMDDKRIGMNGSPTHVKDSFVPVREKHVRFIRESTAADAGIKLTQVLNEAHVI